MFGHRKIHIERKGGSAKIPAYHRNIKRVPKRLDLKSIENLEKPKLVRESTNVVVENIVIQPTLTPKTKPRRLQKTVSQKIRKPSRWIQHLKKYKLEHPNESHRNAVQHAKQTYTKA